MFPLLALVACAVPDAAVDRPDEAEARSLLGSWLLRPELSPDIRTDRERRLHAALAARAQRMDDPNAWIWVGRRLAYLGRYRDAVAVYTEGLERFPEDARLYRHRGHRWITLRAFGHAVDDLEQAARLVRDQPDQVEPDGLPNARGIPTSTLQSNIFYHLGLVHFLRREYEEALDAYTRCIHVSRNPDMLCATLHWTWMTLRRLGRRTDAARILRQVHADMDVIENDGYHRLLLLYKGDLKSEEVLGEDADGVGSATVGFGIANWNATHGRVAIGREAMRRIVLGGTWAAFGFIAAEADLAQE